MTEPSPSDTVVLALNPNGGPVPVLKVPPDLLGDIFLLASDSVVPHTDTTRLNVSSVCAYWRAVALGRATLWSTIVVKLGEKVAEGSDVIAWVSLCLQRSREADLDVHFVATKDRKLVRSVSTLLRPHQHRFRRVHFDLARDVYTQSLLPLSLPLPRLTSLSIHKTHCDPYSFWKRMALQPPFRTASMFAFSNSESDRIAPLLQELAVSMDTMIEQEILVLLHQAPHLVRFKLDGCCVDRETPPPLPSLPELEELEIMVQDRMLSLFDIKAPKLRKLVLRFHPCETTQFGSFWNTEEERVASSPRCSPQLRHLSMSGISQFYGEERAYIYFAAAMIRAYPELEVVELRARDRWSDHSVAGVQNTLQKAYGVKVDDAHWEIELRAPRELKHLIIEMAPGEGIVSLRPAFGHNGPVNIRKCFEDLLKSSETLKITLHLLTTTETEPIQISWKYMGLQFPGRFEELVILP